MKQKIIFGYVRHALTCFGGGLVANGTMTNNQMQQIVGGIMSLIGVLWSHYENSKQNANQGN